MSASVVKFWEKFVKIAPCTQADMHVHETKSELCQGACLLITVMIYLETCIGGSSLSRLLQLLQAVCLQDDIALLLLLTRAKVELDLPWHIRSIVFGVRMLSMSARSEVFWAEPRRLLRALCSSLRTATKSVVNRSAASFSTPTRTNAELLG